MTVSTSLGKTFTPPVTIMSLSRAGHPQVAARIHRDEVAGVQPSIRVDGRGGLLRLVEVAGHDTDAADLELTDLSGGGRPTPRSGSTTRASRCGNSRPTVVDLSAGSSSGKVCEM